MPLDQSDLRLLRILQTDGRATNAALAEQIKLSASACHRRLRQLEQEGVISGYSAIINQRAIGKPTNIFVEITVSSQDEQTLTSFEAAVALCPDVIECYLMSGDSDYLLRVVAGGPADYERIHKTVLSRLPHVARIRSGFAIRTVCHKTSYPLDLVDAG